MISDSLALRDAMELIHVPSRVRLLRSEPLSDGVPFLLRIAAGDTAAESAAVEIMDRPKELIRQAAGFYIEQILLDSRSNSYRVLGANPDATSSELRRNMALLLRWLHPDVYPKGEQSIFATKVTLAWNDLKTLERRAAYDEIWRESLEKKSAGRLQDKASSNKRHSSHSDKNMHRRMGAELRGDTSDRRDFREMGILRRCWLAIFSGAKY
jgi:hypothetical protein